LPQIPQDFWRGGDAQKPVNVSQVRQLSPFRYPGGKTWLVPVMRQWLSLTPRSNRRFFLEPFVGGGIISLTVAYEQLANTVIMVERDDEVAAVWQVLLEGDDTEVASLCARILSFSVTTEAVQAELNRTDGDLWHRAFRTILKNRMQHGGILAPGASLLKTGENNQGLLSRWYPETLVRRIQTIRQLRHCIRVYHADGFGIIEEYLDDPDVVFFLDPPYTAGGKRAGTRLYRHHAVEHARLFTLMAQARGSFLMTYDESPEVIQWAAVHQFTIHRIPMRTTHHATMSELLITRECPQP